ncbi:putative motility protein [Bacillus daqingensis]|uniref:Motility protein n=1 Tax=Bacillus daqingensis TaxID=872396 RepID=A0ABV9NWC4_9BACI
MDISSMMNAQARQLQHTVSLSLMQSALSTQAAQSINMLQALDSAVQEAPHPYAGKRVDVSV